MRAPAFLIASLFLFTACGGDDDGGGGGDVDAGDVADIDSGSGDDTDAAGGACGEVGSGDVTGTVAGEMIDPIITAWSATSPIGLAVVIDELDTTCVFETPGDGGERVKLFLCEGAPDPGTYEIGPEAAFPDTGCEGEVVGYAEVETDGGVRIAESASGTITIDSVADDCIIGGFDITFDDDSDASGTFNAVVCEL